MVSRIEWRSVVSRIEWRSVVSRIEWRSVVSRVAWRSVVSRIEWRSVVSRVEWRSVTVASRRCMASDSVESSLVTPLKKCRYSTTSFLSRCPR